MSAPLVSVIVPLYNRKALIGRCAESVLAQTYKSWELIIVDDGSTDHPEEELAALQARDARIRVIHQPNGGVSVARNTGMQEARGEYIQFLDSDDELLPEALAVTMAEALREQADVVAFAYRRSGEIAVSRGGEPSEIFEDVSNFLLALVRYNRLCVPWNKLWKRSLIEDTLFNSAVSWGEDFIFNLTVLRKMRKGVCIHQALYCVYEDAPLSLSRRFDVNGFADFLAQAEAVEKLLYDMPSAELRSAFSCYLWSCVMQCIQKLCLGSGFAYAQRLETLRMWDAHPRVQALLPYAAENKTWVSLLMQHHVTAPVPIVQLWVSRKTRLAEMLRRMKRKLVRGC